MGDRIRVALVAHDVGGVGGMERVLAELVTHGHRRFDIHVVSVTLAPDLREWVTWHRVTVPRRPFALKYLGFALLASIALRSIHADVVHVTGAQVLARADLSTIHFCHAAYVALTGSLAPASMGIVRRVNRSLSRLLALGFERWCYRPSRLRLAAAVSDRVADEFSRHFPAVPVVVTPNGVDLARFRPGRADRQATRAALGVGADPMVVLFVGGEWDRKGLWPLLEAVSRATARGRDLVLLVVGRGDEDRLRRVAADEGLTDRVLPLGVRSDVDALMGAADVFVLPSEYETYPLVSWEAAASGLPQVVTRTGAVEQLIETYRCGFLLDGADLASEIEHALEQLSVDPGLRVELGRRAARAVGRSDWATTSAATYSLYDDLAR